MIKLYSYWRSSAAYRVRIALNLKKLDYDIIPIHLVREGGEQHTQNYRTINPQALVPTLMDETIRLGQSMAIMEYLEEKYHGVTLLPETPEKRAFARQLAQIIVSDIHPLNNLRVLNYLTEECKADNDTKNTWYQHWIIKGLDALEALLQNETGAYCLGDAVSIADICLIPQLYNAHRYDISLKNYPRLAEIETECLKLNAFDQARPENQADAVK